MGNKILKSSKSNSWLSIISFSIFKINRSIAIWVLLLLSFILFGTVAIVIFSTSRKSIYDFLKNFQYGVFIFDNILLLLFVLLSIVKIFGCEFEDGTYLLLISKPYSRFTLFFLKLISLWILIVAFLGTVIIFALGIGYICYLFSNYSEYVKIYNNLLLKLFIYSLALSFFASSGILFVITFLSSQVVLLIVVVFCSLFLIGGTPYSLIMSLANTTELTFLNSNVTQSYPISIIKSTINFKKNLKNNLIRYENLTNKIWNFYESWDISNLIKVFENNDYRNINDDSSILRKQRLEFYKSLGLTKEKTGDFKIKELRKWDSLTKYNYNGKPNTIANIITIVGADNLQMNLCFVSDFFFKSPKELNKSDPVHKELLDYIDIIDRISGSWENYITMNIFNGTSLFYFNPDKSYYSLSSKDSKIVTVKQKLSEQNNTFNPTDIFRAELSKNYPISLSSSYDNGPEFQEWVIKYFGANDSYYNSYEIKTLFVLREIEIDILKKIIDYKLFESEPFKINKEWQKYNDLMQTYELISKINIIEHWNQIWTGSLLYVPFWFEPLQRSNIDFTVQNNYLMSYQDFRISLGTDQKINLNPATFLNISLLLYIYLVISFGFLIGSCLILNFKNII